MSKLLFCLYNLGRDLDFSGDETIKLLAHFALTFLALFVSVALTVCVRFALIFLLQRKQC